MPLVTAQGDENNEDKDVRSLEWDILCCLRHFSKDTAVYCCSSMSGLRLVDRRVRLCILAKKNWRVQNVVLFGNVWSAGAFLTPAIIDFWHHPYSLLGTTHIRLLAPLPVPRYYPPTIIYCTEVLYFVVQLCMF